MKDPKAKTNARDNLDLLLYLNEDYQVLMNLGYFS